MELERWLDEQRESILDEVTQRLARAALPHYTQAGQPTVRERLGALYDLTRACSGHGDLVTIAATISDLGTHRFLHGYPIQEVQGAINCLEETLWSRLVGDPDRRETLAGDLRSVATVLGVAKDHLAQTYVGLATHTHAPALDLDALASGAGS